MNVGAARLVLTVVALSAKGVLWSIKPDRLSQPGRSIGVQMKSKVNTMGLDVLRLILRLDNVMYPYSILSAVG